MKTVGIIGGMGPKATIYFEEMIINKTKAKKDQDYPNMLVFIHSSIPDRTSYILNQDNPSPLPYLIDDAKKLEKMQCDFLVMTCNTAHYFYDEIIKHINIPFINMPKETAKIINKNYNVKKVGIMATKGTINSKVFEKYLKKEVFYPCPTIQNKITDIIYNKVKRGKTVKKEELINILYYFKKEKCDIVIIGCTELSIAINTIQMNSNPFIIDSMNVLADKTIKYIEKI